MTTLFNHFRNLAIDRTKIKEIEDTQFLEWNDDSNVQSLNFVGELFPQLPEDQTKNNLSMISADIFVWR